MIDAGDVPELAKARNRPPSARERRDEQLSAEIIRLWNDNFEMYGVRKMWKRSIARAWPWRAARLPG